MSHNKLPYETVYNYFKDQGCELLETEYINNHTKMKYRCKCGDELLVTFKSFKQSKFCLKCSGSGRLEYDDVYKVFKDKECELLEKVYINNRTKMKYKCVCGNEDFIALSHFKRGHKCSKCTKKPKKNTLDRIKIILEQNNYTCISTTYKGTNIPLELRCPEGHPVDMTWSNFYSAGRRCKICAGNVQKTIDEIRTFAESHDTLCISDEYINAHLKLEFKCNRNHIYKRTWNGFMYNNTCPECYKEDNYGENRPNRDVYKDRSIRIKRLSFDHRKTHILNDDSNYDIFLEYKEKSKNKEIERNIYEIDHIHPKCAFVDNDLDIIYGSRLIQKICNLRENLRLIPHLENMSKHSKYIQEEFMAWFNEKIKEYT